MHLLHSCKVTIQCMPTFSKEIEGALPFGSWFMGAHIFKNIKFRALESLLYTKSPICAWKLIISHRSVPIVELPLTSLSVQMLCYFHIQPPQSY